MDNTNPERTARIALMHWLMTLPEGTNQACAARSMMQHIDTLQPSDTPASVNAFRSLLGQVASSVPATPGSRAEH